MPDETYDVVIAGGGCKALFLAMYLAKYGGMSVGIFEKRHEIGGGMAGEEGAAPGHLGNTHAHIVMPMYYLPLYRDFPEFEGYGVKLDFHRCGAGGSFADNKTCLTIYSIKYDPTQERTAKEIARFSERDAELYLKLWGIRETMDPTTMDNIFNPPERHSAPEILQRQMALAGKLMEIGVEPEPIIMQYSPVRAVREFWESKEMQYVVLRFSESGARDVNQPAQGAMGFATASGLPLISFNVGGTHNIAHAAHKVLLANGVKIWTHCEVAKVIMENGAAKGIRLTDGTEIGARKLVVSAGLNPQQLCFDLIGREHLSSKIIRRVELIETTYGTIAWYNWALHEAPQYETAAFNPDVNDVFWLGLVESADVERLSRAAYWKRLGKIPPLEDHNPVVWCHSVVDPSYAPEGRHTASHEQYYPHATAFTEREWLELKQKHAEDMVAIWQKHAPNMTWDNIIGHDGSTPWDHCRMINYAPNGCMAGIDPVPYQVGPFRPIPELANYRTPITNLYATGGQWHMGTHVGASSAYNCYKIIAEDLGLGKPWLEPGKEEPESLVHEQRIREKRWVQEAKAKA